MSYFRMGKLLAVAVPVAALACALATFAQTGGVTGKATLQDGSPCVKCPVIIERLDIKGTYPVKTDKKGQYTYIGLPIGNYKITLQDPNGRTLFNFNNVHIGLGDPSEHNFDLGKEVAAAKKEQQANPEVQKQIQEQAKEQKQFTGLKQLFDQGTVLYGEKKYAEAAATFEQAIPLAKDKNLLAVLSRTADSYDKAKQFDKALDYYQKAIQTSPTDANLHNGLGNVYAEMGKIPEAQAEFQKSAELDPANASTAYFNMGVVMYNKGKMDEAAAALKKAAELNPKYAEAYFWEGQALFGKATMDKDGKIVPAPGTIEAFQTYLKLDPNGRHVTEAQAVLQTLQSTVPTEYKAARKKRG